VSFEAQSQEVAGLIFEQSGEPATFTPFGGSAVATRAVVDRGVRLLNEHGELMERRTVITLPKADVSAGKRGDTIDVLGSSYTVDSPLADDGYQLQVVVK